MRITASLPDHGVILEAVLEGFVLAAMEMIAAGIVPPYPHAAGVRYRPEDAGKEEWLLPNQVLDRGYGDCEDLAIWAAAGYRVTGDDPSARCMLVMTGPKRIHCVVGHGDGQAEDVALAIALHPGGDGGFAVGAGYTGPYGGMLVVKDHRTGPGSGGKPSPFDGLPPAAANPNPTSTSAQDQAIDNYMAQQGIKNLTLYNTPPPQKGMNTRPLYNGLGPVANSGGEITGGQGNVAAAWHAMQHAADLGEQVNAQHFGQGVRSTAPKPVNPVVDPYTGQQAVDQYGQPVYQDNYGQRVNKDGSQWVDQYGPYGGYNDPYSGGQYPGMYGLYDPQGMYSQDPFYHGEFPVAQPDYPYGGWQDPNVPYGGWQSEGQPMLTYEDIYGEWTGLDDADVSPGPLPAQYGPLPGAAYGEESYDGQ